MTKLTKTSVRTHPVAATHAAAAAAPSAAPSAEPIDTAPVDELTDPVPASAASKVTLKNDDLALAFPSFTTSIGGVKSRVVPIDITKTVIDLTLDPVAKALVVSGHVGFRQAEQGMPLINMLPDAKSASLDGHPLDPSKLVRLNLGVGNHTGPLVVDQPTYETMILQDKLELQPVRLVAQKLEPGTHQLKVDYSLTSQSLEKTNRNESLTIDHDGLDFFMRMSDLLKSLPGNEARGVTFAGAYLPSNFQFDRIPLTVKLHLPQGPAQRVLTNGTVKTQRDGTVEVTFPKSFTTSEPFLHVVPAASITEQTIKFHSIAGRDVDITTYFKKSAVGSKLEGSQLLRDGQKIITQTLAEMEQLFGPYPHPSFVAQLWPHDMPQDGGTGMEYAGATESSLSALRHETIHSYFGRSLSPRDGNAGWIDEAVTTWLTDGRRTSDTHAAWSHDLGVATAYSQDTNVAAYNAGPNLLRDLDVDLRGAGAAGSGILKALQKVYGLYQAQPISNDEFVTTVLGTATTPEQAAAAKATFARYGLPGRTGGIV